MRVTAWYYAANAGPEAEAYVREFAEAMSRAGVPLSEGPSDVKVALLATGGTEAAALRDARGAKYVLVVYADGMNSQPAAAELSAALDDLGVPHDSAPLASAEAYARQVARAAGLASERPRVVRFGGPAPWLVHSSAAEGAAADVEERPLEELVEAAGSAEPDASLEARLAARLEGVAREHLSRALRVYVALRRASSGRPVTVNCFRLLELYGVTPCLALSLLNSEGVAAGCEGDVPSLVTMYWLSRLSSRPAWMGNVMRGPGGTLALVHCTFPLAEARSFRLVTHFETGRPLAVEAEVAEGAPATIAKYDPARGVLRAIRGAVAAGSRFTPLACRTQVAFRVSGRALELTFGRPLGAHYAVVLDDVVPGLRALAALRNLSFEEA